MELVYIGGFWRGLVYVSVHMSLCIADAVMRSVSVASQALSAFKFVNQVLLIWWVAAVMRSASVVPKAIFASKTFSTSLQSVCWNKHFFYSGALNLVAGGSHEV